MCTLNSETVDTSERNRKGRESTTGNLDFKQEHVLRTVTKIQILHTTKCGLEYRKRHQPRKLDQQERLKIPLHRAIKRA